MGLLDWINRTKNSDIRYDDPNLDYKTERVGTLEVPDKLTDLNAFALSNTVAEIFHPIDFIADRASKLRFYIADKNGIEIPNTELNRFLTNINPLYSFSDLFYQSVFSYLSDGNILHYVNVPSSYKNVSANNISRIDVLQPDKTFIQEYTNLSVLEIQSLNDFIRELRYSDTLTDKILEVSKLSLYNYDMTRKTMSNVLSKSPLFKSYRSINNLLATYSARYNVYVNNGSAGYLSKKGTTTGIESIVSGREDILKDINSRNGITGRRNLWGISSVPIEFVNTLVDIQKLMPFEETLEDSIKIAATFQIPANLVCRKDQSTFNNQLEAERAVWENTLMSIVDTTAANFTNTFRLNKIGYQIKADYSTVSALQQNQSVEEDVIKKQLDNLKLLKELNPELDITKQTESISLKYEQGN
jgi:hypothetical protein